MKNSRYIKIENRGKVDEDLLIKTEEFIKFLCFDFQRGIFFKLSPKLFKVFKFLFISIFQIAICKKICNRCKNL